jgi:hypothetical protein
MRTSSAPASATLSPGGLGGRSWRPLLVCRLIHARPSFSASARGGRCRLARWSHTCGSSADGGAGKASAWHAALQFDLTRRHVQDKALQDRRAQYALTGSFGDNGGIFVRLTNARKTPTKAKVRLARHTSIDDEDGFISKSTKGMTMADYDISRGPYHAILDKMALARQAQTGESYAKAYTEIYTDPSNAALRDGVRYDELARAFDSSHGTAKSLIPVTKAAAPDDPLQKAADVAEFLGPAHARMHSMAVDHQRANPRLSYEAAYSRMYTHPENVGLRAEINREHLGASMAAVHGDGAQAREPAKPFLAYARG